MGNKTKELIRHYYYRFIENHGFYLLCLTLFLLPFPRILPQYATGLFLLSGVIYWINDFKNNWLEVKRDLLLISGLLLFFILHIIWALILKADFPDYSMSIYFILVPILGYPIFKSVFLAINLHKAVMFFVSGIILICLFDYARAFVNSMSFVDGKLIFNPVVEIKTMPPGFDFYSSNSRFRSFELSHFEHPSYLSIKVLFAICLLIEFYKELRLKKVVLIQIVLLLIIFLFSLSSRAAYLSLLLIMIYYFFRLFDYKKKIGLTFFLIPVMVLVFIKISLLNERIRNKTEFFITQINNNKGEIEKYDPRLLSWLTSAELIIKKPIFGYGLKSQDTLSRAYEKKGFEDEAMLHLNPHNQFLEAQLSFGIPGSIALFLMFFAPFIKRPESFNKTLYNLFLISTIIPLIFASLISGLWGTLFYIFFYSIQVLRTSICRS